MAQKQKGVADTVIKAIRALVKRVEVTQERSMSSLGSIRTRKSPTPKKKVCNFVGEYVPHC